ncbi:MAG: DUF3540 domain-containing protein [Polyangiaceae bacterium]
MARLQHKRSDAVHVVGRVVRRDDERGWLVDLDGAHQRALQAVGCIVEPQVGDVVLALVHEKGSHVLCVLDRETQGPKRLAVEGDLAIEARGGSVTVAAHGDFELIAARRAHIVAGTVDVTAAEANAWVGRLTLVGDYVRAELGKVMLFASSMTTEAERVVQRIKRSLRVVEETEHVRAGTIDYRAEGMVNVRGKTTLVTAETLVKLDGEQVHLG